jgi:hypothetical protein
MLTVVVGTLSVLSSFTSPLEIAAYISTRTASTSAGRISTSIGWLTRTSLSLTGPIDSVRPRCAFAARGNIRWIDSL